VSRQIVVGVIPPGVSLNAVTKAMGAWGALFPKHTLFVTNDPPTGGMLVLHDPDAAPDRAAKPKPEARIELGSDEPGDLLAYAMSLTGRDATEGAKALAVWLAEMLEQAGAANYLTYGVTLPDGAAYAVTIQRSSGKTPADRIRELEQQVAELRDRLPCGTS
jgi:hypothetical protein